MATAYFVLLHLTSPYFAFREPDDPLTDKTVLLRFTSPYFAYFKPLVLLVTFK